MTDLFCQYILDTAKGLFFSGNVQTTAIAVAIATSLCCSILSALIHFVWREHYDNTNGKENVGGFQTSCGPAEANKAIESGKLREKKNDIFSFPDFTDIVVPCVRCKTNFADKSCLFVTCYICCFDKSVCPSHCEGKHAKNGMKKQKETEINLSYYGITKCPERLCFAGAQLTLLNLSNNCLRNLPPEFSCLRGLEELVLKNNFFKSLPEGVISLNNLKLLNVRGNCLQTLPESICSMVELQCLDLSKNELSCLPNSIGLLARLEILVIQSNQLKTLPGSMAKLMHLQVLDISNNLFKILPETVSQLIRLKQLRLMFCKLVSLPVSISHCSNLQVLTLTKNRLKTIPGQLSRLHKLGELDVSSNRLQYLPASLLHSNIQEFYLTGNPFFKQESDLVSREKIIKTSEENFPPLLELTARFIVKTKIKNTESLPITLQDMLKTPSCCTNCGDPVFTYYLSKWTFETVDLHSTPCPFQTQLCSPHLQQRCRLSL